MGYVTEDLIISALAVIKKHKVYYIEDISIMMGINKATFYSHKLNENDDIKAAILKEKISIKSSMRSKWYKSENATLQMGLYKLLSNDDERMRLTQQYHQHEGTIDVAHTVDLSKVKTETLAELFETGIIEVEAKTVANDSE